MADKEFLNKEAYEFWSKEAVRADGTHYYDPSVFDNEGESLEYDELKNDNSFIRSAQACYRVFEGDDADPRFLETDLSKLSDSDREFLKDYAYNEMAWFNNNFAITGVKALQIRSASPEDKMGVFYQINLYNNSKFSFFKDSGNFIKQGVVTDPFTLGSIALGFVTFGGGTAAALATKEAAKSVVKKAIKSTIGRMVKEGTKEGAEIAAKKVVKESTEAATKEVVEKTLARGLFHSAIPGAIDGSLTNGFQQYSKSETFTIGDKTYQRQDFSGTELAISGGFGAAFGAGFGLFGRYVVKPRIDGWKTFAQQRMDDWNMAPKVLPNIWKGATNWRHYFHIKVDPLLNHFRTMQDNDLVRLFLSLDSSKTRIKDDGSPSDYIDEFDTKGALNSFKDQLGKHGDSSSSKISEFNNKLKNSTDELVDELGSMLDDVKVLQSVKDKFDDATGDLKDMTRNADRWEASEIKKSITDYNKTLHKLLDNLDDNQNIDKEAKELLQTSINTLINASDDAIADTSTNGASMSAKNKLLRSLSGSYGKQASEIQSLLDANNIKISSRLSDFKGQLDNGAKDAIAEFSLLKDAADTVQSNTDRLSFIAKSINSHASNSLWEGGSRTARIGTLIIEDQLKSLDDYGSGLSNRINGHIANFEISQKTALDTLDTSIERLRDKNLSTDDVAKILQGLQGSLRQTSNTLEATQDTILKTGLNGLDDALVNINKATGELSTLVRQTENVGEGFLDKKFLMRFQTELDIGHVEKKWDELSPEIQQRYSAAAEKHQAYLTTQEGRIKDRADLQKQLDNTRANDKASDKNPPAEIATEANARDKLIKKIQKLDGKINSYATGKGELLYVEEDWIPGQNVNTRFTGENTNEQKFIEAKAQEYADASDGAKKANIGGRMAQLTLELLTQYKTPDGQPSANAVLQSHAWSALNYTSGKSGAPRDGGIDSIMFGPLKTKIDGLTKGSAEHTAAKRLYKQLEYMRSKQEKLGADTHRGAWREAFDQLRNSRYSQDFGHEYMYNDGHKLNEESKIARDWFHGWGDNWIGKSMSVLSRKHAAHTTAYGDPYYKFVRPLSYAPTRIWRHFIEPSWGRVASLDADGNPVPMSNLKYTGRIINNLLLQPAFSTPGLVIGGYMLANASSAHAEEYIDPFDKPVITSSEDDKPVVTGGEDNNPIVITSREDDKAVATGGKDDKAVVTGDKDDKAVVTGDKDDKAVVTGGGKPAVITDNDGLSGTEHASAAIYQAFNALAPKNTEVGLFTHNAGMAFADAAGSTWDFLGKTINKTASTKEGRVAATIGGSLIAAFWLAPKMSAWVDKGFWNDIPLLGGIASALIKLAIFGAVLLGGSRVLDMLMNDKIPDENIQGNGQYVALRLVEVEDKVEIARAQNHKGAPPKIIILSNNPDDKGFFTQIIATKTEQTGQFAVQLVGANGKSYAPHNFANGVQGKALHIPELTAQSIKNNTDNLSFEAVSSKDSTLTYNLEIKDASNGRYKIELPDSLRQDLEQSAAAALAEDIPDLSAS